jgi:ribose 1,5-bisphosphokinase
MIAVVGASGVGKDSVMAGMVAADPSLRMVRRVITRAADAGGEDFTPASLEEFEDIVAQGGFWLHWAAHGLRYGIPVAVGDELHAGGWVLVNLSRGVLAEAQALTKGLVVLELTASADVLAERLSARGRETKAGVAARLKRADFALPAGLHQVHRIDNSGPFDQTVAAALTRLHPERA